jgi:hypothetical protein
MKYWCEYHGFIFCAATYIENEKKESEILSLPHGNQSIPRGGKRYITISRSVADYNLPDDAKRFEQTPF